MPRPGAVRDLPVLPAWGGVLTHVEVPAKSLWWSLLPSCDSEVAAATPLSVVNTGDHFYHKITPWPLG
ncbi:hypothetical protein E2C01_011715 [Portunus trituberculatus]|uniref:Uncharacterized protein n=1 Tax=Portunus trituberculatus TaxID=210409 RepID=A0A5B7DBT5_PORTR|nr:hypothetical protein [Portunus trituberculatus]